MSKIYKLFPGTDRNAAKLGGYHRYISEPCPKCNCVERKVCNNMCLNCSRGYTKKEIHNLDMMHNAETLIKNVKLGMLDGYNYYHSIINRQESLRLSKDTYEGDSCKVCQTTTKYTSNYYCKQCSVEKGLLKLNDKELMAPYRTNEKYQKYRDKNREKVRKIKQKYAKSDKGKISGVSRFNKRRANKLNQTPTDADFDIIKKIYEDCQNITKNTGIIHHVDHIIPLCRGGLHHQDNLQIITAEENYRKGGRLL